MTIGSERPAINDEPKKRGCVSRILFWILVTGFGLIAFGFVAAQLHRASETPQQRAKEDWNRQVKSATEDKAQWVKYSRAFAEVRMQKALKDPESARFRNITIEDQSSFKPEVAGIACGQVNAKNSFGGYTGFKSFMVVGGIPMEDSSSASFVRLWNKHCTRSQLE